MSKPHKRQRWMCKDPGGKHQFLVEVLTAKHNGHVDLKVIQIIKGNVVEVGQILRDELFSDEYDTHLVGQDATI